MPDWRAQPFTATIKAPPADLLCTCSQHRRGPRPGYSETVDKPSKQASLPATSASLRRPKSFPWTKDTAQTEPRPPNSARCRPTKTTPDPSLHSDCARSPFQARFRRLSSEWVNNWTVLQRMRREHPKLLRCRRMRYSCGARSLVWAWKRQLPGRCGGFLSNLMRILSTQWPTPSRLVGRGTPAALDRYPKLEIQKFLGRCGMFIRLQGVSCRFMADAEPSRRMRHSERTHSLF